MIPLFKVFMSELAAGEVAKVLKSGYVGQGPKVDEFEDKLKQLFECDNEIITVNSGTSALDLAYHLCGIGPGDRVITTAATCSATIIPLAQRKANVIYADVDPLTGLIDPKSVAKFVTPNTKAIVAVDWAGLPCDYDELKKFGIPVIEDAAHALCSQYKGKDIAVNGGDYVAWSFQAIKHLTTGDGGALKTPPDQTDRARLLRWFGYDRRSKADFRCSQVIQEIGYKYQMNDIAAAIGLENIKHSKAIVDFHREKARLYSGRLSKCKKIRISPFCEDSAYWLFTLILNSEKERERFIEFMKSNDIATSPVHARVDKHPELSFNGESLPGLNKFMSTEVAIPIHFDVTFEQAEYICDKSIEFDESR